MWFLKWAIWPMGLLFTSIIYSNFKWWSRSNYHILDNEQIDLLNTIHFLKLTKTIYRYNSSIHLANDSSSKCLCICFSFVYIYWFHLHPRGKTLKCPSSKILRCSKILIYGCVWYRVCVTGHMQVFIAGMPSILYFSTNTSMYGLYMYMSLKIVKTFHLLFDPVQKVL